MLTCVVFTAGHPSVWFSVQEQTKAQQYFAAMEFGQKSSEED